jgi:PKD domain
MNENLRVTVHRPWRPSLAVASILVVLVTLVGFSGWQAAPIVAAPAAASPSGTIVAPAASSPAGAAVAVGSHGASSPSAPVADVSPPAAVPPLGAGLVASISPDAPRVAALSVSPTSGPDGTVVTFTASEYSGNSVFTLEWLNGSTVGGVVCAGKTNLSGGFTCRYTIPLVPYGGHLFQGVDAASHTASATFTTTPSLTVNPATGLVGTPVTFTGTGYNTSISVAVTGTAGAICSGTTNAAGTFSCSYSIPPSPAGALVYQGTAEGAVASTTFTVIPGLTVGPLYGMPGTAVTFAGTGFSASGTITVSWTYGTACTSAPSGTGGFSCGFTIPTTTAGGAYTFGASQGSNRAAAQFVVTYLDLSPVSGPVGTNVTFTAGGFTPSTSFTLSWSGGTNCTGTTSATGTFGCTFTIPATTGRGHPFTALDSKGLSASATFTVLSVLVVSPIGGQPTTPVTFSGTGFNSSSAVAVTWAKGTACTATTMSTGSFSCASSIPSGTAGGVYTFTATDASTNTASATFAVTYLAVTPSTGPPATPVTLTGGGFVPKASFSITWNGLSACSGTAGSSGSISCSYTLPASPAGTHPFTATDGTNSATALFTVTSKLTLSPTHGQVGATVVSFTGTGFNATSSVTVKWSGGTACSGVTTTSAGSFTCSFTIPPVAAGTYTFNATDGAKNTASATFQVLPRLVLSPTTGTVGTAITYNASGYASNSAITISWTGGTACAGTTTAAGSFNCTYRLPPTTFGTKSFNATDARSDSMAASFAVTPFFVATPSAGPIGTIVTFSGTGFAGTSVAVSGMGGPACVGPTSSIGNFTCSFTVPPGLPYGAYPFTATDTLGDAAPPATFTVLPHLSVSPASGPYNTTVTFSGTGYSANTTVSVTFSAGVACTATTGTLGTFSCTYLVGIASVGAHVFTGTDEETGRTATATFSIVSQLGVSPAKASPGTTVTFVGHGYAVGSNVTVTWAGGAACIGLTNSTGSFSCLFTVPATFAGAHSFRGTDQLGNFANATLTVVPVLSISPGSGAVGTTVTFTGLGFASGSTVTVTFSGGIACSATSNSLGSVSCSFVLPASTAGQHVFTATDSAGSPHSATASFSVSSSLKASPSTGPVGTSVSFAGSGYSGPGIVVTVTWSHGTACSGTTNASGSFACTFTVPLGTGGGAYPFTGTDVNHDSAATSFFVTPVLTDSPPGGGPGTLITFHGAGYNSLVNVTLSWSGGTVCIVKTDASGNFSCVFTIPGGTAGGVYLFTGTDTGSHSASVAFAVTFVHASPASGPVGTSVTFTAGGFAPLNGFNLTWVDGVACFGETNSTGGFTCTFVIPAATAGAHTFTGADASSHAATTVFTVVPLLSATPSTGPVGTSITFRGAGYGAGATVNVSWAAGLACSGVANTSGSFSCQYTIPAAAAGAHAFTASDPAHDTASASFTVTSALTVFPTAGFPGSTVRFNGTGYASGSVVNVTWGSGVACTATASASGSFSCTYTIPSGTAPGTDPFVGTDTNSHSASASLTVYGLPSVSVPVPVPAGADVGQPVNFTTSASGGSGSYRSYHWSESSGSLGCVLGSGASITCTPTAMGTFTVSVNVTDSRGGTSASMSSAAIVVSLDPTVTTPTANRSSVDIGQSVEFSTTGSGGSGGLSYTWSGLPKGCPTVTTATVLCTPTTVMTAGPVRVSVIDSNGFTASSPGSLSFTVFTDPSAPRPTVTPATADVGQTYTFSEAASGGTMSFSYLWSGLPKGCSPTNSSSIACLTTVAVSKATAMVTVTDTNGFVVTSLTVEYNVTADPTVGTPVATPVSVDAGQRAQFSVTATGFGTLQYTWSGLPSQCTPAGATVTCTPITTANTYTVSVSVQDGNAFTVVSNSLTFVVYPGPTVGVPTADRTSADVGQGATFTATALGGSGGFTYTWANLPTPCTGTGSSVVCTGFTTAQTFRVTVTATDSDGLPVTSLGLNFTVFADPTLSGPTSTHVSVDVNQPVTFFINATKGSGGYTYLWSGLPPGCTGTTASVTCTPSAVVTSGSISVVVTDSNGKSVASSTLTFTVFSRPVVTLTVTSSSPLQGTSIIFTAMATGGSGGDHYNWTNMPAGCSGSNKSSSSTLSCKPTSAGAFSPTVTVTDSNNASASASVGLSVKPTFLGLPAIEGYAVLGGSIGAVVLVGLLIALLVARRRRRESAPIEWTQNGGAPAAPAEGEAPPPLEWAPPPAQGEAPPQTDWTPPPEPQPWAPEHSPWEPPTGPEGGAPPSGGAAPAPAEDDAPAAEDDWSRPPPRGAAVPAEEDEAPAEPSPARERLPGLFRTSPSAYGPGARGRAPGVNDAEEADASEVPGPGRLDRRAAPDPADLDPDGEAYAPDRPARVRRGRIGTHDRDRYHDFRPAHRSSGRAPHEFR